jgi:hypothetical protein
VKERERETLVFRKFKKVKKDLPLKQIKVMKRYELKKNVSP